MANTADITANITPENATNQEVIWESSNEEIATVEGNGLTATITGVSEGETTITAITEDGGHEATCAVTVKKREVPVESTSIEPESVELETPEGTE